MIVRRLFALSTALTAASMVLPAIAHGAGRAPPAVSEVVMDADTGRIVFTANARRQRPPASLAKMMTLLLVFDELKAGRLRTSDKVVMTAQGARQQPSRLGLARGKSIGVAAAMRTVAVISANDIAVAFADRIGGSEAGFVRRMNRRAVEIGMTGTRFGNATGLAPGAGLTTAADMALLARYIVTYHPDRYKLFATRTIRWKGQVRPNHNQLLGRIDGVDGVKTGYTVAAGFNLAASARRRGRRVIVVVMGAPTAPARDLLVANLLESGFTSSSVLRTTSSRRLPLRARSGAARPVND